MTASFALADQQAGEKSRDAAQSLADRLLPWAIFLAFLLVYSWTAAPSIVALFDDTLEFQLVLPTFGIAHPTGYPLYTLAGGVWNALLPFGNAAGRTNLLSAVAAAATVALVFVLARRLTPDVHGRGDNWAGAAATIAFGFGPIWWQHATVAEVYALHNLLVAAILVVAVGLRGRDKPSFDRRIALLCILLGLGLAHHRTIVLLLPALAIYLIWLSPSIMRPRRVWLLWLAALVAPLLLYAYLPLRASQGVADLNAAYENTWSGFWDHVLARRYTSFFASNELSRSYGAAEWLLRWIEQTGWAGAILTVLGLGMFAEKRLRPAWMLVYVTLVANLLFTLAYRVADPEVFLLPALMCAAVLAGGGLAVLRRQIARRTWATAASIIVLLLLAVGYGRGAPINRSGDWAVHDYAVDMAKVDYPPGSRVIGIEGEMTALKYMQATEGLGSAAEPVVADDPTLRHTVIMSSVASGAPTYVTRELDGIASEFSFSGEGPLVRAWPRGETEMHAPSIRSEMRLLDGRLLLEGYDAQRLEWAGGPILRVVLYWLPSAELDRDLKVSLRIVDSAGDPVQTRTGTPAILDAFPLRQVAGTKTWAPNVPVRDVYEVRMPESAVGAHLLMIVYDAETLAEVGRLEAPLP